MIEELKPCPFCGGNAQEGFDDFHHGGHVKCVECGVTGPVWSNDTQDAINAWNKRTSNTLIEEQAARIAGLEDVLEEKRDSINSLRARLSEAVKVLERLAEGERSDEGHTALRDAAKAFIATLGEK